MTKQVCIAGCAVLVAMIHSLCLAAEPAPLVGEWKAVAAASDGKARDKFNFDGMRWTIGKETLEISPAGKSPAGLEKKPPLQGSYSVDDTKKPAHFNWTLGEGEKKTKIDAIYELKDDVLRICFPRRGGDRPDGFDTEGKEWTVYEFKRIAKE